jgi:hypothetical protein
MSLEAAINENTATINKLIAALATGAAIQAAEPAPAAEDLPIRKRTPQDAPAEQHAEEKAAAEENLATAEKTDASAAAIDYAKEVKPLLVKVSTAKGRDALVTLLAKFGVSKGDQLPQDQLAAVLTEINALLAA